MDSQSFGSPQPGEATPAHQNKQRGRGRARKSNNGAPSGNTSDSANLPVHSPVQHAPKPRHYHKHNSNQYNNANAQNSPRNNARSYNAVPATPLKEQAYAGPTFHASPDPSSLPIPKFFRLANQTPPVAPPSPGKISDDGDVSPPASPSKMPTKTLDMFFAADRKERVDRERQAVQNYETVRESFVAMFADVALPHQSSATSWRSSLSHSSATPSTPPSPSSSMSWRSSSGDSSRLACYTAPSWRSSSTDSSSPSQRSSGVYDQPRPRSSDSTDWREQPSYSPRSDERAPFCSSRQQRHSPPDGGRVGNSTSNGQTESPQQAQSNDPKAMAEDLKRILKIA